MNNIKATWELVCNELEFIQANDLELVQDQILFSVNRQIKELEEIQKKVASKINQLTHVIDFIAGFGEDL